MTAEWDAYADALRRLATAREAEQERQSRLASNLANAASSANANVRAAAARRDELEQELRELEDRAAQALADARVARQGPMATISSVQISDVPAARQAIVALSKQLHETVEHLHDARRRAREARAFRRNQLLALGLVIVSFIASKVIGGSYADAFAGTVAVIVSLLTARAIAKSFVVGLLVGSGVLVAVLVVYGPGGPWWLALLVLVLAVAAIVLWSGVMSSRKLAKRG